MIGLTVKRPGVTGSGVQIALMPVPWRWSGMNGVARNSPSVAGTGAPPRLTSMTQALLPRIGSAGSAETIVNVVPPAPVRARLIANGSSRSSASQL